jgi:hypothetical protein
MPLVKSLRPYVGGDNARNTAFVARKWCSPCLLTFSGVWVYVVLATVPVPEV